MLPNRFNDFVIELKNLSDESIFEEQTPLGTIKRKELMGIMYFPMSTCTFDDVSDMDKFIHMLKFSQSPEMLFIKNRISGDEVEIYRNDYKHHTIVDGVLNIEKKNGKKIVIKILGANG